MDDAADEYVDLLTSTWARAATRPEAPALRQDGKVWTYGDLVASASSHARALVADGLEPGDRVLLVAPTGPAFVQGYLGALAAGAVVVPANPSCTERELEHLAADAGGRVLLGGHETGPKLEAVAGRLAVPSRVLRLTDPGARADVFAPLPRAADEPAVLLYTSGTTGRPKGAVVTLGNIAAATTAIRSTFGITEQDRVGTALPLFHVFGQVAVLGAALVAGACVSLLRPFTGEGALRLVERDALTVLCGVPTMWIEMIEAARTLDPLPRITTLRLATSGGAALPSEANRAFAALFGAEVRDGYGLSETTGIATFNRPSARPREGSAGQAAPGVDVRVVDPDGKVVPPGAIGEVTVAGPNVMAGYWGRPEDTATAMPDGRLRTGDLGRLDEDGYLWIVGRTKELIIRGGYNVYPREIEDALYEHPAVLEAAVIGLPDPRLGEEVAAVVAFRAGDSATPDELRAWLDERVAPYKVPRLFQVVAALPKGATGKVQKTAIDRDQVAATGTRTRRTSRP